MHKSILVGQASLPHNYVVNFPLCILYTGVLHLLLYKYTVQVYCARMLDTFIVQLYTEACGYSEVYRSMPVRTIGRTSPTPSPLASFSSSPLRVSTDPNFHDQCLFVCLAVCLSVCLVLVVVSSLGVHLKYKIFLCGIGSKMGETSRGP